MKVNSIKTPTEFITEIERIVAVANSTYLDAIHDYCYKTGMDPETAAGLIRGSIKIRSILFDEAQRLNLIPKTNKIPGV